ncbi:hypothetical protein GCM10019016_055810 [Streptomyces prasinosporus]|uniref:Uncharacterized protein n=1 Tax=Streptomyces prasinosporus TaxID=68256 RepID=A0ABP6TVG0_9ACTN|nr:hypothetical protein GCM10010332_35220 [Streptomyces albogriseolus]
MRAVVRQAGRAAALAAEEDVGADADGRDDRDRADDDRGHLAPATAAGGGGLGRHAVRGLLAVRRLAVRGLLRVAVAGLGRRGRLLGVAVTGLRGLRLSAVRSLLSVRTGLLRLPAVRPRLVVTHDSVPLETLNFS